MFTVDTAPPKPVRVDLEPLAEGMKPEEQAHILFKPLTTQGKAAGRGSVREVIAAGQAEAMGLEPRELVDVACVAFTVAAARWGVLSWVGVGDADGVPIPATPDNVQMFLEQHEDAYVLVDTQYVRPALEIDAEKKGSAPSPNGTSPGRGRASAGGRSARPARSVAKPAPTKKTARKRPRAKPPGGR